MKHWLTAVALAGLGAMSLADSAAKADETPRPNFVIIMADDLGFSDIGCYGGEIETPNLDRLAAAGLRFTQFYNSGRCCPTRAALLTGLYQHQAGVGHMIRDLGVPSYQGYLNQNCLTIAEALRSAGYRAYLSGKWHVGENQGHWPVDRGFDRSYSLVSGATNYWRLDRGRVFVIDGQWHEPGEGWYATDAFSDHAVAFVEDAHRHGKPFFLYLPYTAPHWPLHAHQRDIAKYKGKYLDGWDKLRQQRYERLVKLGLIDSAWPLSPRDPKAPAWDTLSQQQKETFDHKMAVYAAQIDSMDQGIGRLISRLEELGQLHNTLIVFLADNGGCHEGVDRGQPGVPAGPPESFLSYGLPWANASNTPFRWFKHWVHEGGIATPCIVHWPAGLKHKGITHDVAHVMDLMPTCLELAGAEYPQSHNGQPLTPLEGKSLVPVLNGQPRAGYEYLFWEHSGNRAVRHGKWKLVSARGGDWELYDLAADRSELNNLAQERPQFVAQLTAAYDAWAERAGVKPWPVKEGVGP
jgi:arylsulfatase A-like enzyme